MNFVFGSDNMQANCNENLFYEIKILYFIVFNFWVEYTHISNMIDIDIS